MSRTTLYAVTAALSFGVPAQVAAEERDKPLRWHIGASYSLTSGTTEDYLDDGFGISGGITWYPRPAVPVGLRAELHYTRFDATDELIQLGSAATQTRIDDGNADVFGGEISGIYDFPIRGRVKGYTQVGIGFSRREVELEQTVLFNGIFCDPWWGFCFEGVGAGNVVVAETDTTRFAWSAGLGLAFPLPEGSELFLDARYLRIETQDATEFIPIRVGLRF